jgi:hypothetical protein
MTKHFWLPVRVTSRGFLRIEAASAEAALEALESGAFTEDELVNLDIDGVECIGAPAEETTA